MNSKLASLLKSFPILENSTDDLSQQVADLVEVARTVGLTDAADYLEAEVNYYRKWYGPKRLHPEQVVGEVHLLNSDQETVRYIGWKTKRIGKIALDTDGVEVPGQVPVFVIASELAQAGQLTKRDTIAK